MLFFVMTSLLFLLCLFLFIFFLIALNGHLTHLVFLPTAVLMKSQSLDTAVGAAHQFSQDKHLFSSYCVNVCHQWNAQDKPGSITETQYCKIDYLPISTINCRRSKKRSVKGEITEDEYLDNSKYPRNGLRAKSLIWNHKLDTFNQCK